ncbi:MAG TPA: PD-(D/E)XK nuclease family protein [Candidatus Paceibacterota bacterium]|nr:PD-(D/E)XK nuclease family protein [Candidatus Paceibacterota bacterium]HRZ34429.1 PD-(D/E)XK nuclease family protein [Candidatus Paceibacterota bacterium]
MDILSEYKRRNEKWNYGGPNWKLSRSKIDLFNECPRCFYLDNKLGIRRPSMPPFNLNVAVDALLKKEFDIYRAQKKPHPLMKKYKIEAIPFQHKELEKWRDNFVGLQYLHEPTGMTISGAIDDVWINSRGELYVVDYKATSKDEEITLDDKWKDGYKRQIEVYQWLFRQCGFEVSDTGYFVYANGLKDKKSFDNKLEFDLTILDHVGNTEWVEPTIFKIKEVLDGEELPNPGKGCEHCASHKFRSEVENT